MKKLDGQDLSKILSSIIDMILEACSTEAFSSYKKASSLEKQGLYDQAMKEYKKYLAMFPEDMAVYRKIALLYYLEGKHQKAYEFFSLSKIKEFKVDIALITDFFDFLAEIDPINISSYQKDLQFATFFSLFREAMDKIYYIFILWRKNWLNNYLTNIEKIL